MRHPSPAVLVALMLSAGLAGCSPQAAAPDTPHDPTSDARSTGIGASAPPAASRACEGLALMLTIDSASPRSGQTVSVSVDPAECRIDEQWAGELIVRTADGDTSTGSRLEIGATSVSVDLPPDLTGPALLMLAPDQDCEQAGATGDCHYPFAEIEIRR
ncbi:hypothetical protein ACIP5T_07455 [Microbacterium sp. NPDC088619]|uniref:hypothetical protein n=1 Tax=Microbacterium sp. NPDC088619 TaxID=3364196 RepID=UPI00381CCB66